jgi:hypothetical protein
MSNPWLRIPLADYEGHMKSEEVQQLDPLAELFAEALRCCHPASIAVLGIAGGNGLDRIDTSMTKRIVGLDINPLYLEETRQRYVDRLPLELHCMDLCKQIEGFEPVQLVHAALVFEHAGVDRCLENAFLLVAPGGALSIVLQLPSESVPGVSGSQFLAMQELKSDFTLIDPAWLQKRLAGRGFSLTHQVRRSLPAGKGLWMGIFSR